MKNKLLLITLTLVLSIFTDKLYGSGLMKSLEEGSSAPPNYSSVSPKPVTLAEVQAALDPTTFHSFDQAIYNIFNLGTKHSLIQKSMPLDEVMPVFYKILELASKSEWVLPLSQTLVTRKMSGGNVCYIMDTVLKLNTTAQKAVPLFKEHLMKERMPVPEMLTVLEALVDREGALGWGIPLASTLINDEMNGQDVACILNTVFDLGEKAKWVVSNSWGSVENAKTGEEVKKILDLKREEYRENDLIINVL